MSVVIADGLIRRFGAFTAVDDVGLRVAAGEIVGLVGANGAGKTTLMRLLLGLLRPTAGRVTLFGTPPSRATRRRIGYVPQDLGLYRDLTVAENLRFRAGVFGLDEPEPVAFGDHQLVGDLPLGLQRRVAFVAATQHRPDLLILDEPTSGVSPLARMGLWDLIRATAEAGAAVLVSTHYMDEAEQADRVILMSEGRIAAAGTMTEIVGSAVAIEVTSPDWHGAFELLDRGDDPVTLAGTAIRVLGDDEDDIRRVLAAANITATTRKVTATLEEKMVMLER